MKRTVALLALCGIVSHTLARSTYPILLPAIEEELLGSHQLAGALTTINFAAYLVGVGVVTAISGRTEPIRLLLSGLISAFTTDPPGSRASLSLVGGVQDSTAGQSAVLSQT